VDTSSQARELRRRRRYSPEHKRRIVEECLGGSESVSVVARRHDINANLLFNWRRLYRQGLLEPAEAASRLVAVRVAEAPATRVEVGQQAPTAPGAASGQLEIGLAGGHRLVVRGALDPALLRAALEVLGR